MSWSILIIAGCATWIMWAVYLTITCGFEGLLLYLTLTVAVATFLKIQNEANKTFYDD